MLLLLGVILPIIPFLAVWKQALAFSAADAAEVTHKLQALFALQVLHALSYPPQLRTDPPILTPLILSIYYLLTCCRYCPAGGCTFGWHGGDGAATRGGRFQGAGAGPACCLCAPRETTRTLNSLPTLFFTPPCCLLTAVLYLWAVAAALVALGPGAVGAQRCTRRVQRHLPATQEFAGNAAPPSLVSCACGGCVDQNQHL